MAFKEEPVASHIEYRGKVVNLRVDRARIGDGSLRLREVVEHPGGVAAAVLTSEDEFLMVRQFRYARGEELLELPAGKLESGEDPYDALCRELREETGTLVGRSVSLGVLYPTPAYDTEVIHLWACRAAGQTNRQPDDGELLSVERVPLDLAERMALEGKFPDAKTQIGILRTAALVREGAL